MSCLRPLWNPVNSVSPPWRACHAGREVRGGFSDAIVSGRCPILMLAGLWPLLSFAPTLGFDVSSAERGWGGASHELPPALAGGLERATIVAMGFKPTR